MKWCENRLIPTFQRLYGKKQLILILDNAKYHHHRGKHYINPNKMNKAQLASQLVSFGYTKIIVPRPVGDGSETELKSFTATSFYRTHSKKHAPTADELRQELKQFLKANPDKNPFLIQRLFNKYNYILIYTPPYTPAVQPIEMAWAYVKGYVAKQYKQGRTLTELKDQTKAGFYGNDDGSHKGITSELCQRLINDCHKWCNKFIHDDDVLDGTLYALKSHKNLDDTEIDVDDDIDDELEDRDGESSEVESSDEE